jgi:hypothetical protein
MRMRSRLLLAALLGALGLSAAVAAAGGSGPRADAASGPPRRIELPAAGGQAIPFTVEVPAGWKARAVPGAPRVWVGPPSARPDGETPMLHVLVSTAPLGDPQRVVESVRAGAGGALGWTAPLAEVRAVGGLRGVLVQLDSGEGETARSTLALKLPAPRGSVDFMLSARRADFERLRPLFTSILTSVRRTAAPAAR